MAKKKPSKLTQWINSKLKEKGLSVSAAKKDVGKYKTISAAKKAGSLYYTNPKGTVMIAAFKSDLDNIPSAKSKETSKKSISDAQKKRIAAGSKSTMSDEQKRTTQGRTSTGAPSAARLTR